MSDSETAHVPVMPREILHWLDLEPGNTVLDGTVGAGGHSVLLAAQIGTDGVLIGLDRDPMMLNLARQRLDQPNVQLVHSSYADADKVLATLGIDGVDAILVDLGLSSDQLKDRQRGFGFDAGGTLDMRFDVSAGTSAAEYLSTVSESDLAKALHDFGEERFSDRIAAEIIRTRRRQRLEKAADVVDCVERSVPRSALSSARKHPATRVFQALRIVVNEELEHVRRAIEDTFPAILRPGGRCAVLSFHSLEDRIIKSAFKGSQQWQMITRTPLTATPAEQRLNPRSRSAKLRVAQRT